MQVRKTITLALLALSLSVTDSRAMSQYSNPSQSVEILSEWDELPIDSTIYAPDGRRWDEMSPVEAVGFALDTLVVLPKLPMQFFLPAIYDHFEFTDTIKVDKPMFSGRPEMRWIEEQKVLESNMREMERYLLYRHPERVRYNIAWLPVAPKQYHATVDPTSHKIEIKELIATPDSKATIEAEAVKKRHWIRNFKASLHFTQAYVSPNWYQGGNDNLNMVAQLYYNVKLNQEFHPKLLFDFTGQYKLGMNSAPDDSLRNYSISDDLLQINTIFGVKATKRWYYSIDAQFKTQLLNSYASNTRNLRSAFLSPADLNAGIGMTYTYNNKKKTFSFEASFPLLSYNLKICTNREIDETKYTIKKGHTTVSSYGSTANLKLFWRIVDNITYESRLYTFTDYDHIESDWENTLVFEINKFLTTKLNAHLRYDSSGVPALGTHWKKLQVKEILSIGFDYKFASI